FLSRSALLRQGLSSAKLYHLRPFRATAGLEGCAARAIGRPIDKRTDSIPVLERSIGSVVAGGIYESGVGSVGADKGRAGVHSRAVPEHELVVCSVAFIDI